MSRLLLGHQLKILRQNFSPVLKQHFDFIFSKHFGDHADTKSFMANGWRRAKLSGKGVFDYLLVFNLAN